MFDSTVSGDSTTNVQNMVQMQLMHHSTVMIVQLCIETKYSMQATNVMFDPRKVIQ